MQNVVQLSAPTRQTTIGARQGALMKTFAAHRRVGDDVFWLKENAEVLNVLQSVGADLPDDALAAYEGVYTRIEKRMEFFPQYYRFLLSICLDLEDLGRGGDKGARLVQWVADQGLVGAELSDLQRAEARRLCLRRGVDPVEDAGLDDRLRGFIARSDTFAMPNKKAAYELTHIVFYLSEYGSRDPGLDDGALESLSFAGTLAYLDQNFDLLSEICIALRFAGQEPPAIWESWLTQTLRGFAVLTDPQGDVRDDYHQYLMGQWFMAVSGRGGFGDHVAPGRLVFVMPRAEVGPLRELSESLFQLDQRSGDWTTMRGVIEEALSDEARCILSRAEEASGCFDQFFEGFARVSMSV